MPPGIQRPSQTFTAAPGPMAINTALDGNMAYRVKLTAALLQCDQPIHQSSKEQEQREM
jgi:hypothetical protein